MASSRRIPQSGVAVAVVTLLLASACSSAPDDGAARATTQESRPDSENADGVTSSSGTEEATPADYDSEPAGSALRGDRNDPSFPTPLVDPSDILSGGPAPDGIPPIDDPKFASVADTDYLADEEGIITIELAGEVRGYPVQVLMWHEIVNDEIGGIPVTITYCPLCNSAVAFHRQVGDRLLDFGTSGELYQSALVMYDRQTESLWAHFTGQAIVGHYAGLELDLVPAQTLSYRQFAERHPDALVLTTETGHARSYGLNPYVGYDDVATGPIGGFISQKIDDRIPSKSRIVGVLAPGGPASFTLEALSSHGVVYIESDDEADPTIVVWHQSGLNSPLEDSYVDGGRDVGQTGAFVSEAEDGQLLTFSVAQDQGFIDDETGSTWAVTGEALSGPLEGQQLTRVPHLDTFWFAWSTYRPGTTLVTS